MRKQILVGECIFLKNEVFLQGNIKFYGCNYLFIMLHIKCNITCFIANVIFHYLLWLPWFIVTSLPLLYRPSQKYSTYSNFLAVSLFVCSFVLNIIDAVISLQNKAESLKK